MVSFCQLNLEDQSVKVLCDFMVKNPSKEVVILPRLVAISTVAVKIQ